uniref:Uncharacterized protein n=1 Tax=Anguilla anguilla TaxID=7936 RepID=A0A0E9QYH7_ANGAN
MPVDKKRIPCFSSVLGSDTF